MMETVKLALATADDLCVGLAAALFGVMLAVTATHTTLIAGSAVWHLLQR